MRRPALILALVAICAVTFSLPGRSQVPAGPPYEPEVHPNPIVTFVTGDDFAPASYAEAREKAGIDLLGLSSREGERESVGLTESFVEEVEILGNDTGVLFYPAVRQSFRLVDGRIFLLYSFRDPLPTDIPSDVLAEVLDRHAFRTTDKPEEARFGPASGPERLEIRGSDALLFQGDGDSDPLVLFWQDARASHVAVAPVSRERLFQIVDDLL